MKRLIAWRLGVCASMLMILRQPVVRAGKAARKNTTKLDDDAFGPDGVCRFNSCLEAGSALKCAAPWLRPQGPGPPEDHNNPFGWKTTNAVAFRRLHQTSVQILLLIADLSLGLRSSPHTFSAIPGSIANG